MTLQEELEILEQKLKKIYLGLSDQYKVMSKFKDAVRLDNAQSGIDNAVQQAAEIRAKMHPIQRELVDNWQKYSPAKKA